MPLDAPMPESVMKLAEFAREAGWEVRVQYARGNGIHGSTGKPTGLVHSLAVRMGNHPMTDAQAVAVYVSGSSWTWKSIWVSGPELPPFGAAGLTELKEWLDAAGDVPPGWYSTIAERVAEQERRRKIKEACDRGTHGNTITLGALTSCHYCTNSWETGAQPWRKPKKAKEHA
jgi:hypothetical protein